MKRKEITVYDRQVTSYYNLWHQNIAVMLSRGNQRGAHVGRTAATAWVSAVASD